MNKFKIGDLVRTCNNVIIGSDPHGIYLISAEVELSPFSFTTLYRVMDKNLKLCSFALSEDVLEKL